MGNFGQKKHVPKEPFTVFLLLLILSLALGCRLYRLVPPQAGLLYAQDADEGVYATTAQLALQGYLPYRDFFTPMPPVAIYLFMSVLRLVYHPWGSPIGLMALRYASVALGLATVLLTFFAANLIGGRKSGLLAAGILAFDGIVMAQDRRAMLEALTNFFSLSAILCYLCFLRATAEGEAQRKSSVLVVLAGFFCALALLSKGTAVVPLVVIVLAILVQRYWREAWLFILSFLGGYFLCAGFFLISCPADYIKQMYLFHLLRPWDGTAHPFARLIEIWNYPWSWATVRIALVGTAVTLFAGQKVRQRSLWFLIANWALLVLLLLLSSRTYWATYFSQLAVPLAILGGSLLNEDLDHDISRHLDRLSLPSQRLLPLIQRAALVILLVLGLPRLARQFRSTKAAMEQIKPAYTEISAYIYEHIPAGVPILVFEPNYTFLSSHPPAGARDGSFFIDSYGEMLYRNLGIPNKSVFDLLKAWMQTERVGALRVFHEQPAQHEVLAVFSRAPYVVLDGRALKQLTPEVSAHIRSRTQLVKSAYAAELRVRLPE